jgi:hypothetical protein
MTDPKPLPKQFLHKLLNIKCLFCCSLPLLSKTFLTVRKIQQDTIINVSGFHVNFPLIVSDFNQTWIFVTASKNTQISNLM